MEYKSVSVEEVVVIDRLSLLALAQIHTPVQGFEGDLQYTERQRRPGGRIPSMCVQHPIM